MSQRLSALLVAAGAVAALTSCGDPTAIKARLTNIQTQTAVFALNFTPFTTDNAVRVRSATTVPATAGFLFDIAFDLTDTGTVKIITARALATELAGTLNRVGLRDSPELTFDGVIDPPRDKFVFDSTLVVPVGRTVLLDIIDLSCQTEAILGFNIKSKLRVDSIVYADRRIHFSMVSNPNCGFRLLVPGGQLPKE
jgi:hypothetical protein